MFAPFLPFVTEEVWSWWQTGSIHKKPWPKAEELHAYAENPELLADVSAVLTEVRKAKTVAQLSMRADVSQLVVNCNDVFANHLKSAQKDLFAAGRVQNLEITQGDELSIKVSLA